MQLIECSLGLWINLYIMFRWIRPDFRGKRKWRNLRVNNNIAGSGERKELSLFVDWYNRHRSHGTLDARTPAEVYHDLPPAYLAPRFEPRRKWPRGSPCAAPPAPVRSRGGQRLELRVSYFVGRKHLPIVELNRAA